MLVGGSTFSRHRVAYLLGMVFLFCLPAAGGYAAASLEWIDWPSGSTSIGLVLGIIAAAIIAFEMFLWPRKQLRRYRLGRTRVWMYWHVWLGLVSLPLVVIHSGYHFGGLLTTAVLVLFLFVIASGVWGLAMQQVLPQKLLHDFPIETIETEDDAMVHLSKEAHDLVDTTSRPGEPLFEFYRAEVDPYLTGGRKSGSGLHSASRAANIFEEHLARQPDAATMIRRLKEMCDLRRQYEAQTRIHWWLHNWLNVHLPLSVALSVLLIVHIVTALKYW